MTLLYFDYKFLPVESVRRTVCVGFPTVASLLLAMVFSLAEIVVLIDLDTYYLTARDH